MYLPCIPNAVQGELVLLLITVMITPCNAVHRGEGSGSWTLRTVRLG